MDTLIKLTHKSWLDWFLIIILSGLAASILSQVGAWLVTLLQGRSQERLQKSQQEFQERSQLSERENQSLQLLIAAHFKHREKCLEDAANVREWILEILRKLYGPDYGYYGDSDPPAKIKFPMDALDALNRISYYHPTRSIRSKAKDLRDSIGGHFNNVNGDEIGGDPAKSQLDEWLNSADEIIEFIHTPPTLDEIKRASLNSSN